MVTQDKNKTEVIDRVGQESTNKKCIELVQYVDADSHMLRTTKVACKDYIKVHLLEKSIQTEGYDVILCTAKSGTTYLYLGHWNDGVIEQ